MTATSPGTAVPPRFSSNDPGTSEASWRPALAAAAAPAVGVRPRLVVVSAHPDDEMLGCGGLIHDAINDGAQVTVVLETWGEASHPGSPTHTPADLAALRRTEMEHALGLLAAGGAPIGLVAVGLPDGRVGDHHEPLTAAIVDAVGLDGPGTVVIAPWRDDGHPDHAAAGRAGAAAAARTDAAFLEYPIWFWHWATPERLDGLPLRSHRLSPAARTAKARAIDAHRSQTVPLSPAPEDGAVLPSRVVAHFTRDDEHYVRPPSPTDHQAFEPLHRTSNDPWDVGSRYERDKRAATTAVIDRLPPLRRVLEIGCSVGALTAELAQRAPQVDALEPSPSARAAARAATAHLSGVTVRAGAAPADIGAAQYDLVVLSEVGYFLSPAELRATLDRIHDVLVADRGWLLGCHWCHPIEGWPLDGAAVHRAIDEHPGFVEQRRHTDAVPLSPDYELRLWCAR